jgi:tyrosinase
MGNGGGVLNGSWTGWTVNGVITSRDRTDYSGNVATDMDGLLDMEVLIPSNFDDFDFMEANPHARAHQWIGGDMGKIALAVRDPLFFMLHSNVDRLWAEWQGANNDRSDPNPTSTNVPLMFSQMKPDAYDLIPNPNEPNGNFRIGHEASDTMWPWNGVIGSFSGGGSSDLGERPNAAPGGSFPSAPLGFSLGPNTATPQVLDFIDYFGRHSQPSKNLGFCYDIVNY